MDIKLFSDILDALGKITSALKSAASLPKAERDQYREVIGQNYQLLDSTLGMIVTRLGDILLPANEAEFQNEVGRLDNNPEWMHVEREFRLCRSLRASLSETRRLSGQLRARIGVGEVDTLVQLLEGTASTEFELGEFIAARFRDLSTAARVPGVDAARLRQEVRDFREALLNERSRLIRDECAFYSIV